MMPRLRSSVALLPSVALLCLAPPARAQSNAAAKAPRPVQIRLQSSAGGEMDVGPGPRGEVAIDLALVTGGGDLSGSRGPVFRIPGDSARRWVDALTGFFGSGAAAPPLLRLEEHDRRTAGTALVVERQALPGVADSLVVFRVSIESRRGPRDAALELWRTETREFAGLLRVHLRALDPAPPADSSGASNPGEAIELEYPVEVAEGSCYPAYPEMLRRDGRRGVVRASYIVGVDGRVERGSVRIIESTQEEFSQSVRKALPCMRFIPAEHRGRRVRQLVQQPFTFDIAR